MGDILRPSMFRNKVTVTDAEPVPERPKMSITDLINQCNEAMSKMGANNPNRELIFNCAYAMRQLVDRLAFHEAGTEPQ